MKNFKKTCSVLFLIFSGFIYAQHESHGKIKTLVEQQNEKWMKYYNNGNPEGVASLHTDDAMVFPPNSDFVTGKDQITQMYKEEIANGGKNLVLRTLELIVDHNHAYETGNYAIQMNSDKDSGKYLVVWQKQTNGEWLCLKDIWNSSQPLN